MSDDSQQGITRVLQQEGKLLETLLQKLEEFKNLKRIIDIYLDSKLASKCSLANFENGHLAIVTESAIWATQFRFQMQILQKKLLTHREFKDLKEITCKVRPNLAKPTKSKLVAPVERLTDETARIIEECAKNISYEKLRKIMKRIASHKISS